MAIILTGDGGWAGLDKSLAAGFAARGIPSIGWNSLRYYWTPRTPDGAAADLARIIRHYMPEWMAKRVILVGYWFGADVLPSSSIGCLLHCCQMYGPWHSWGSRIRRNSSST